MVKPIIYIIGDGRSGSTILEEYIAQELNGIKIGEARRFWFRFYEALTLCECNQPINLCDFWSNVEKELSDEFKNAEIHQKVNEAVVYKKNRKFIFGDEENRFLTKLQNEFYNAVSKSTNAEVIIDSSKVHGWGIHLDKYTNHNILFIHLVRDIGSVANSWKKNLKLPEYIEKEVWMPKRSVLEHIKTWFIINFTTLHYFKNKSNYIYIDYKEFCENPNKLIEDIKKKPVFAGQRFSDLPTESHGIGGNPVRKSNDSKLEIKYNDSKGKLSFFEKSIYYFLDIFYKSYKKIIIRN